MSLSDIHMSKEALKLARQVKLYTLTVLCRALVQLIITFLLESFILMILWNVSIATVFSIPKIGLGNALGILLFFRILNNGLVKERKYAEREERYKQNNKKI